MAETISVNGTQHPIPEDPRVSLLDFLRRDVGLTGTKKGCDHGQCGACTVIVNGIRINSCLTLAAMHDGDRVTTIEGLGSPGHPHAVQLAWLAEQVPQCGYCQSGMLMAAAALLAKNSNPGDADIDAAMTNLCRCGSYPRVRAAIKQAAKGVRA